MPITALRRHRKARSLRQIELARLLDVEQSTISNYEVGKCRPTSKRIKRDLEQMFGLPLSELLAAEPDPATTNGAPKGAAV